MTVGDERRPGRQVGGDGRLYGRVGDRPEPVRHAVVGDRARERFLAAGRAVHKPGGAPAAGVPVPGPSPGACSPPPVLPSRGAPAPAGCPLARRRYKRARWAPGCCGLPSSAHAARRPARPSPPRAGAPRRVPTATSPMSPRCTQSAPALLVHVQRGRRRRPRARPPSASRAAARRRSRPPPARRRRVAVAPAGRRSPPAVPPGEYVGRMSRTTLYGEAASNRSRVPGPITSYGGDVTFASPPTRDRS